MTVVVTIVAVVTSNATRCQLAVGSDATVGDATSHAGRTDGLLDGVAVGRGGAVHVEHITIVMISFLDGVLFLIVLCLVL